MTVEKYYQAGCLAVLVSPGFGAGWSTWNNAELAYDARIIKHWLDNRPSSEDMESFLKSIGYENVYMGGYYDLRLEWVPKGQLFCIHEYDGSESIETPETMCMMFA